jgi:hypothetical protein
MFFKQESESTPEFPVIKAIVAAIKSDLSDDDTRDFIFKSLRENGMTEESYLPESKEVNTKTGETKQDVVFFPGTGEFMIVVEEFNIRIEDRIYHMIYYLN